MSYKSAVNILSLTGQSKELNPLNCMKEKSPLKNEKLEKRSILLQAALTSLGLYQSLYKVDWDKLSRDDSDGVWEESCILLYGIRKKLLTKPPKSIFRTLEHKGLLLKAYTKIQNLILDEIVEISLKKGIKICLLKGALFSRKYYPETTLRPMGDIDILVKEEQREDVSKILENMGAVSEKESHAEHDRFRFPDAEDVIVEVHTRLINLESILQKILFPKDYLKKIPWDKMIEFNEGWFELPVSYQYNYMHLHALKEGYKSLKWFIDIALMKKNMNMDIENSKNKFINNTKTMTYDIMKMLLKDNLSLSKKNFLWKRAINAGQIGDNSRIARLTMALACAIS